MFNSKALKIGYINKQSNKFLLIHTHENLLYMRILYLFIKIFIYTLFKVDLHITLQSQLTSTIKTRLDICTCCISIEL